MLGSAEINKIAKSAFLMFFMYNSPEKDVYSWTLQCEIREVSFEGLHWLSSCYIMHLEGYKRVINKLCMPNVFYKFFRLKL